MPLDVHKIRPERQFVAVRRDSQDGWFEDGDGPSNVTLIKALRGTKWHLWHGCPYPALRRLESLGWDLDAEASPEEAKLLAKREERIVPTRPILIAIIRKYAMNSLSSIPCLALACAAITLLGGCTTFAPVSSGQAAIGQPVSAVEAKFGKTAEEYPLANGGTRRLYPTGPLGQNTYAADFDNGGNLTSFRQILTTAEFARIQIGRSTQEDVLHTFGKPEAMTYYPLSDRRVWTYRFRDGGWLPSLMNVIFDRDNVVRVTQIVPDPLLDSYN